MGKQVNLLTVDLEEWYVVEVLQHRFDYDDWPHLRSTVIENCRRLLEKDEAILIFPEGVKGIAKLWHERYQLREFGLGFMRLALETNTPIVPVAVIGAEEQAPSMMN
jgi:1-acyl-sn-glycerol-3-phosphate acyltransferase